MTQSIEEIALQHARKYIDDAPFYIAMSSTWLNDSEVKARIDKNYPDGWDAFYEETFREVVG